MEHAPAPYIFAWEWSTHVLWCDLETGRCCTRFAGDGAESFADVTGNDYTLADGLGFASAIESKRVHEYLHHWQAIRLKGMPYSPVVYLDAHGEQIPEALGWREEGLVMSLTRLLALPRYRDSRLHEAFVAAGLSWGTARSELIEDLWPSLRDLTHCRLPLPRFLLEPDFEPQEHLSLV